MKYGMYVLLFQMPDAKRIMTANSIWATTDQQRATVFRHCKQVIQVNPDVTYDPATFLNGPFTRDEAKAFVEQLEAKLNAEDPHRQSVKDLQRAGVLNDPARLLDDPEIARMLKAHKDSLIAATA